MTEHLRYQLGDYQTPQSFADAVVQIVKSQLPFRPTKIIEPTCGIGGFLLSASKAFPDTPLIGVDINPDYLAQAKSGLEDLAVADFTLFNLSVFDYEYEQVGEEDSVLIIGNPPWATNSNLSSGLLQNLPQKSNHKKFSGIEALTGASNFDICEYIMLDALIKLKARKVRRLCLAMLCKTIVAHNLYKDLRAKQIPIASSSLYEFNASKVFQVSADACLLVLNIDNFPSAENYNEFKTADCFAVYELNHNYQPEYKYTLGFVGEEFVINLGKYNPQLEGICQFTWRQGVKHDASKVMELGISNSSSGNFQLYINGYKQLVSLEAERVFPLLKSSDIAKYNQAVGASQISRHLLLPQNSPRDETAGLAIRLPLTWAYLQEHAQALDKRKSTIYKNAPRFAVFGVGEYSFSRYKVAVSGLYKQPKFIFIQAEDKPIMLDDTCYFLSFDDRMPALICSLVLNSNLVQEFLLSIANLQSMRPFTKKLLSRINLYTATKILGLEAIQQAEREMFGKVSITQADLTEFLNMTRT